MQLKRIGIAVVILAGGLVAACPWAQTARIGTFEVAVQDSRAACASTDGSGAGRFDPYTQGHRTGWFDPYTEGMGHPVVDLVWLQRNT